MDSASRYRREPSAYSTPSASEDLPDPDTPAMPTILFSGMSTSMFFRLCTFAPRTSILSIILFFLPFGLFAPDEFDEARASVGRGFPVWDNDKSYRRYFIGI